MGAAEGAPAYEHRGFRITAAVLLQMVLDEPTIRMAVLRPGDEHQEQLCMKMLL